MSAILAITATILFLASLPVVIELAAFLAANLLSRRPSLGGRGGTGPEAPPIRLAILIPAHNEEKGIARCVASALAAGKGKHDREVIVIADNCDDSTAERAREAGARVIERVDQAKRGKGAAIDYAISALKSEGHGAFVIIDADTVVSRDFVEVMGDRFASGAEALQCVNLPLNVESSPRIRLMRLALLSMNVFRPIGREKLGLSAGLLGNGFGLSKSLVDDVPYSANSITEDLEYHLRLIEKGHKVRFVADASVLSDFPVSKEGSETQRARWEGGRFMLQRKLFFPLLGKVMSGKLALAEPFLELMSMPLSYAALALLALVALPGQPFRAYGAFGLLVVLAQTVAAAAMYGARSDFTAFAEIPAYIFWKIVKLPRILLNSRRDSSWVRTKRD